MGLIDRFKSAWSAFTGTNNDEQYEFFDKPYDFLSLGSGSTFRPDRAYYTIGNERSIVTAIYNRISLDCSTYIFKHVQLDEQSRYLSDRESNLNECLSIQANKDQTGKQLIQDIVTTMFDKGVAAVVPVDTTEDPRETESWDVKSLRVGCIVQWFPDAVTVDLYNDRTGLHEQVTLPKSMVAIIENPLYAIMNEPNSTLKRLIRKLNLLDLVDESTGSNKLNLIVQLPYIIKTQQRKDQAEKRRQDIEDQLNKSKYGIIYTDGTEKVTQLNRPIENNLLETIKYLTETLYSQLNITQSIMDGTADEKTMQNYNQRLIRPILDVIADQFKCKFLTKTARTQKQTIMYFTDPFKLVPASQMAELADKFTRNEILSPNEMRAIFGFQPVQSYKADELRNRNINEQQGQEFANAHTNRTDQLTISEQVNEVQPSEPAKELTVDDLRDGNISE